MSDSPSTTPYNPLDSITKGLPAIIVGAIAMVASGLAGAHGITLDSGTVSAAVMGLYGIVNGLVHYFTNAKKK